MGGFGPMGVLGSVLTVVCGTCVGNDHGNAMS